MHQFKRIFPYLKPYLGVFVLTIILGLILSGITVGTAGLVKRLYDGIFTDHDPMILKLAPVAIICLYLVQGVIRFFHMYLLRFYGNVVTFTIRGELHAKYTELDLAYLAKRDSGLLMSRLMNDITQIQIGMNIIATLLKEPFAILGLLGYLMFTNIGLAMIAILTAPILVLSSRSLGRSVRKYSTQWQEEMENLTTVLKESLDGARVIRAFNLDKHRQNVFEKLNQRMLSVIRQIYIREEVSGPIFELLAAIIGAGLMYYAGTQVIYGKATSGDFAAFFFIVFNLQQPIKKLQDSHIRLQHSIAAIGRVFEVLDTPSNIPEPEAAGRVRREFPKDWKVIEFDHVWFSYEGRPILKDINLKVKRGEMLAIVGPSGAGKSTLVNLLPRYYDVTKGSVRVDGVDIREIGLKDLREMIGLVTQEVFLFNEPLRDNVFAGQVEDGVHLEKCLNAAYASDFVKVMSEGAETKVGDRGGKLSGGERQRVSIARAVYKNAPILILDEATSSLDSESEKIVQKALDELMVGRTTLVIAHRLSTIQKADRILVISDGKVAEEGKHVELMARQGLYQKLHDIQFQI